MSRLAEPVPAGKDRREQVGELSTALQAVHRRLLESARHDIERAEGPVAPGAMYRRVTGGDPALSWLRDLSSLIAGIDAMVAGAAPLTSRMVQGIGREVQSFLDDPHRGFAPHYVPRLQMDPALVMDHAALRRALGRIAGGSSV